MSKMASLAGYYFHLYFNGLYSCKFHNYCEENNFPTPYSLCYHEDPTDRILLLYRKLSNAQSFKTHEKIIFEKFPFDSSFRQLKHRFGKPANFNGMFIGESELKVFGYKKKEAGQKLRIHFYYVDNQFFMGEYFYPDYQSSKLNNIGSKLLSKFGFQSEEELSKFYIYDDYSTSVFFEDNGFNMSVRFFSERNKKIINALEDYFERKSEKEEDQLVGK